MDIRTLRQAPPAPLVVNADLAVSFSLWLEFEWWKPHPDDDPTSNFFNMQITLSDQRVYALNVWTYSFFTQAYQEHKRSKDAVTASFMLPPDLFVERLDRSLLENVVAELIRTNSLRDEWLVPQLEEDAAEETK